MSLREDKIEALKRARQMASKSLSVRWFVAALAVIASSGCSKMDIDEFESRVKYCHSAGMESLTFENGLGYPHKVVCINSQGLHFDSKDVK